MKKLLFFASDFKIGLSALLTDQLISIAEAGVDVCAVAGENEQEQGLADLLERKGVELIRVGGLDTHAAFNESVRTIEGIVAWHGIDIIHVQNNWQLAIAGAVRFRLIFKKKVKIAYTLHGFRHNNPIKSRIAQAVIGSALFLSADYVICMTEYLRRKFRLLSYKIKLIPLGVKDDYFLPKFVALSADSLRMVFPAQFREGKNQDVIVRAFAGYVRATADNNARLTLPGSGPMLGGIKALAKELGVEHQVAFPGQLSKDEVKRAYLDSNIAIVASNSETFGQSIVEPFVLGRCVVTTPVGIAPEIIEEGKNGFIFTTESELTDILRCLSADKEQLSRIGNNNYKKRHIFKWESVTRKYISELLE